MRFTRLLMGALLAMGMAVSVVPLTASPAQAASQHVGTYGNESRCQSRGYRVCYYYSTWTAAYWGGNQDDGDLGNNYFFSGSGSGAGQVVRNNARKIQCDSWANRCFSYYSPGWQGNYDWLWGGEYGELYYTWNDNASVYIESR
ncbi:hypothetical protein [Streptomyces millisiae]|uniref:Peptidase inhibitor n=1 Tax=Streptomyces millisiae TaxID=3075542 RepID=A0ABU2LML6_9ACTN|nr:hypothetical protein [Streptomyces sp. DSM 44918]MDT0318824.1 hypothetical protein [Streptomyces sp. DSM 44918]